MGRASLLTIALGISAFLVPPVAIGLSVIAPFVDKRPSL
jgi:hypothetical protein